MIAAETEGSLTGGVLLGTSRTCGPEIQADGAKFARPGGRVGPFWWLINKKRPETFIWAFSYYLLPATTYFPTE